MKRTERRPECPEEQMQELTNLVMEYSDILGVECFTKKQWEDAYKYAYKNGSKALREMMGEKYAS